jgi:dolichol-phosphate mannosyltransferase
VTGSAPQPTAATGLPPTPPDTAAALSWTLADPTQDHGHSGHLAAIRLLAPLTIVVPTYREAENIPHLIRRVAALRERHDVEVQLLFMDDASRDGSAEIVAHCGHDWVRLIERTGPRGLSPAVLEGMQLAQHPVIVCMDCDLSHPPERIPELILALESGQQFVIGSRYVPGGSTDDQWGLFRWLNSRVATLLARPLTSAHDPMSGFFAIRRSDFCKARNLNPIGYKIALELIVKCGLENIGEVPIHFADRVHGQSKLSLKEQFRYLHHLLRLYGFRFAAAVELMLFLAVGASGLLVNLTALTLLWWLGLAEWSALAGGVALSTASNFLLDLRFLFQRVPGVSLWKQVGGLLGVMGVGALANFTMALGLRQSWLAGSTLNLFLAALLGVAAGTVFNLIGNRYLAFTKRRNASHRADDANLPPHQ